MVAKFLEQSLVHKTLNVEQKLNTLLNESIVGLLFCAHFSTPGKNFLINLKRIYNETLAKNLNFELVYISLDENEKKCLETFGESHGNWFLWPFNSELKKLTFIIIYFLKKAII